MERPLTEPTLQRLMEVGRRLVSDLELEQILSRVLESAIEVTGARYAALGVLDPSRERLQRFLHLGIDESTRARIGDLPTGRGVLGLLISDPKPLRLSEVTEHPESFGFPDGHPSMHTFLGVPITVGGQQWGNLYITEKRGGGDFDETDERIAVALSEWAAVAIGNAGSIATERLRFAMEAAEQERLQWARELHDESLQGLAAIRLILAAARRGPSERLAAAVDRSIDQIDTEIASMRALISDLRPDSLNELGIASALEGLSRRISTRSEGVEIEIATPDEDRYPDRLPMPIEVALYRVAQEAITNAIRHGGARRLTVELRRTEDRASIEISDDGAGFDPASVELGYGIIGMRERAELAAGALEIDSRPGEGATVALAVPLER